MAIAKRDLLFEKSGFTGHSQALACRSDTAQDGRCSADFLFAVENTGSEKNRADNYFDAVEI